MKQSTCVDCGSSFDQIKGRGRRRIRCLICAPRQKDKQVSQRQCWCGNSFTGIKTKKYCSYECRQKTRMVKCGHCKKLIYKSRTSAENPVCNPCRKVLTPPKPEIESHICQRCDEAWTRPATKGQQPKYCPECRIDDRKWIPRAVRYEIYERDGWICQICHEPVDRELIGTRSSWRPSLDHVTPRVHGGSDEPENLRLAHFWCNGVLNDGRKYVEEDFRVTSRSSVAVAP